MHDNNLIKLLKTFSQNEFREFYLLVNSPFFNREKVLMKFSEILKKHYPGFVSANLDKKKIFIKLFSGKKYNDALMRNTVSDMLKLAEEYLKITHLRKDPFYEQYMLLKELTNRKQQKLYKMNFKKAENILKSTGIVDELYYQNNFLLEDEHRRNVVVNSSRILFKDDNMDRQAFTHNLQFLVTNVKLYAILLNQSKFTYDHRFDFTLFELIRKYIEENFHLYKNIPYVNIFYNCVMLFKTDEKKYFDELKLLLKKYYLKLSIIDRKNMFIALTNYSNNQIKAGRFEFLSELFDINLEMLKTKAYFEGNDFMAHYIYQAIALNAVSFGKVKWAENFVNKYRKLVHSDFRESTYNFCKSVICIEEEKYDEALVYLSKVKLHDVRFKMLINTSLLKIYFCKNESESFFSLVDSFRHFLKRNKDLRNDDRIINNNFVLYLSKIYKLKMHPAKNEITEFQVIKDDLDKNNEVAQKKWLCEKLNNLINELKD